MSTTAMSDNNCMGAESYLDYYKQCSPEKQRIFDMECSILLECKACGEIFRSVVYFISHKRTFCRENSKEELNSKINSMDNSKVDSKSIACRRRKSTTKSVVNEKQDVSKGRDMKPGRSCD